MNWGDFFMEPVVQGVIITAAATITISIVGGTVGIIKNIILNKEAYEDLNRKLDNKMGSLDNGSLSKQHENMERNLTNTITDKASNIYFKVDSIDKLMSKNEGRYESLNFDQKEIKNNIDKLLLEWQNLSIENNNLRRENHRLRDKIYSLQDQIGLEDEWELE